MRKRESGFTLFEIVAAIGILLVTLGISLSALRSPGKKRAPDSAAGVLLTALQAAQSEARGKGIPTGVALACRDGEAASGFYTLQGHVMPRVVASTDLRNEFPETCLVAAAWGSGLSNSLPAPGDDFLPAAWDPPHPEDPTLIFLPSGKVLSNGLFHQNGTYRFVIASGLSASPMSNESSVFDPPGTTRAIAQASNAWTIEVSQSGEFALSKGLPGSPVTETPSAPMPILGKLPSLSQPSGEPPEILKVKGLPEYQETLPPGIDAMIPEKGVLSLLVEAWSPDGEPLYAKWSGPGEFSSNEPIPLEWDPVDAVWRGTVEYKLPITLEEGDDLTLQVRVADRFTDAGVDLIGAVSEPLSLEVTEPQGKIAFTEKHPSLGVAKLTTTNLLNDDGTGEVLLYDKALLDPAWSPDGTMLVGVVENTVIGGEDLVVFHTSVGPVKTLSNGGCIRSPKWSHDGTSIAFLRDEPADLYVINLDGSGFRQLTPSDGTQVYGGFSWNGNDTKLVYTDTVGLGVPGKLHTVNAFGPPNPTLLLSTFDESQFPYWLPVEDRIAFVGVEESGVSSPNLYTVNPDGTGLNLELDNPTWTSLGWTVDTTVGVSSSRRFLSYQVLASGVPTLLIKDLATNSSSVFSSYQCPSTQMGLWSPIQDRLLSQESSNMLVTVRPDGSDRFELTKKNRNIERATWGR